MWSLPDAITKLFVPTSSDTQPFLHLTLQELNWQLNRSNAPLITAFLSPRLTKIDIAPDTSLGLASRFVDELTGKPPIDAVSVLRAAIKMSPSSLQFLRIYLDTGPGASPTGLTEEISTFILRSGESLREFHSNLVLSPEAVIHLWNLPNLHAWTTEQIPPPITALIHDAIPDGHTSLLPSLRSLQLRDEAALEWLSLFDTTNNSYPPQSLVADNLSHLLYAHSTLVADSTLLSKFIPLINLVEITAGLQCMQRGAGCASRFSDQDVEHLALALPKLEVLKLGEAPCSDNTCPTTILSLLFLSIHCASLRLLSVHFRTTNMAMDVMAMVDYYAHSHDLHQRPKCALGVLVAGNQIPPLEDYEFALVSMGISTIFPSLTRIQGSHDWGKLERLVTMCGKVQESTDLMKFLNELRLSELSGGHLSSSLVSSPFPKVGGREFVKTFTQVFHVRNASNAFLMRKFTPATQRMIG